ncbi:hypothetical protein ABZ413_06660 [Nocardia rhamnosiphila]|uniref:hypothetical protein n=1 Tax=Nocardia rhamnosiphila TaxID=426716 RepID=UPI0033C4C443
MGVNIWVGVADWARLTETLQRSGADEMWDLLFPFPNSYDSPNSHHHLPVAVEPESVFAPRIDLVEDGVLWWPTIADRWYARGVFRGIGAGGSYKPHFYLRDLVEHTAQRADAPKETLAPLGAWLSRLLPDEGSDELAAMGPGSTTGIYGFPPAEVAELAQLWRHSRDRIEDLRPAITAQLDEDTWLPDFDSAVRLLRDWGEILIRAQQHGWGLFYLID